MKRINPTHRRMALSLLLAVPTALASAGCDEKTPTEKAVDSVEEAADETGDAVEEAADETGDAVEDAVD
jgi:hypothetical protein